MKLLSNWSHKKMTSREVLRRCIQKETKIHKGSEGEVSRVTFRHGPEGIISVVPKIPDTVVYKRYFVPQTKERQLLEELNKEADHHIIHLYGYTPDDSSILVEACETDLFEWYMKHYSKVTTEVFWSIACQLLEAIHFCHSRQIAHTDIKLENIGVTMTNGKVCLALLDFGRAVDIGNMTQNTVKSDHLMGSCPYTAPEVIQHSEINRSDIYAIDYWEVGVVLYSILEGEFPFNPINTDAKCQKKIDKQTHCNICRQDVKWSRSENEGGKRLVMDLLDKNSKTRLNFDSGSVRDMQTTISGKYINLSNS